MILGMSVSTFTVVHTVLSLIGIAAGLLILWGMFSSNKLESWTALFLATTVLTCVTGFMFGTPLSTPANAVGILTLVILAVAILAFYVFRLAGFWRWVYVGTAVMALYLNVFVPVVQAFQKLPFLRPLAPTQSEPPFAIAQGVVLVIFVLLGILAVRAFHPTNRALA